MTKERRWQKIDVNFHWIKDWVNQNQVTVKRAQKIENLGDYPIKHHYDTHLKKVCLIYNMWKQTSDVSPCKSVLQF